MFQLACASGWFPGLAFERVIEEAAKRGFKAVEILNWQNADLGLAKQAIDRTGCAVSAILYKCKDPDQQALIANTHGIVHEDALEAFLQSIRETLPAAQAIGCKNIVVTTGNERADVPRARQHDNVVHALKAAAQIVKGSGVTLELEPLNVLVNHAGYYLTTTEEGVQIIEEVNAPEVKLLYDIYHQQITEGNLISNLRTHIGSIGHIHVADVPGRKEPGTGEINYKNVFAAIAGTPYDGYVAFECGLTEDVDTVCKKMWALMP